MFRTLLLADLLSGLGDSAAPMATFDPLSGDSDNNASTNLEIGTQALESYAISVAFLLFQGAIEEAWQTVVNQPGNSYLPAGSELPFYVNGEGKGSEIRIKKTNSITPKSL